MVAKATKLDQTKVSDHLDQSNFNEFKTVIMHLSFSLSVDICTYAMEKCKDQGDVPSKQCMVSDQQQSQGVIEPVMLTPPKGKAECVNETILIKEEPPDSPQQAKIQGEPNGEIKYEVGDSPRRVQFYPITKNIESYVPL